MRRGQRWRGCSSAWWRCAQRWAGQVFVRVCAAAYARCLCAECASLRVRTYMLCKVERALEIESCSLPLPQPIPILNPYLNS